MKLFNRPYRPTVEDLHKNGRKIFHQIFCMKVGWTISIGILN